MTWPRQRAARERRGRYESGVSGGGTGGCGRRRWLQYDARRGLPTRGARTVCLATTVGWRTAAPVAGSPRWGSPARRRQTAVQTARDARPLAPAHTGHQLQRPAETYERPSARPGPPLHLKPATQLSQHRRSLLSASYRRSGRPPLPAADGAAVPLSQLQTERPSGPRPASKGRHSRGTPRGRRFVRFSATRRAQTARAVTNSPGRLESAESRPVCLSVCRRGGGTERRDLTTAPRVAQTGALVSPRESPSPAGRSISRPSPSVSLRASWAGAAAGADGTAPGTTAAWTRDVCPTLLPPSL